MQIYWNFAGSVKIVPVLAKVQPKRPIGDVVI